VRGDVLCQKRSGVVVVRAACKKKEAVLDLAQFRVVGPKGDKGDPGSIDGVPAAGDLTGTYPAPTIAAAPAPTEVAANPNTATDPCSLPTPESGIYCGISGDRWRGEAYGIAGIKFWRDRLGAIHLRGSAEVLTMGGIATPDILFYLPAGARPTEPHAFPIATGHIAGSFAAGAALLIVYPDGAVSIYSRSDSSQGSVFLGEVVFRPDA
jgi:hypothetical protein